MVLCVDTPFCTYKNAESLVSMTILYCLLQCNFEQWAREEGLERPTSSKPKPKSKPRERMLFFKWRMHLQKFIRHSNTLHLRLSALKRCTSLWSCIRSSQGSVHHFETYPTYRLFFHTRVSTNHVGSWRRWQGSTRVENFWPCLPSPSIFTIYTPPPFHYFKRLKNLYLKTSQNYSQFTP